MIYKILCLLALSVFFGCGKNPQYKIGISQCSSDDWRSKMNDELTLEATLQNGVDIEIRSAEDSTEKQISDIQYFVDNGFDAIIIAPNESAPLTPVVKEVYEKGIPVIIFDRNIDDTTYTQRIGVDNIGLGRQAANYVESFGLDSVIVMEIYGLPGSSPADERSRGFAEVLSKGHGRIAASAPGNWQQQKAEQVADSMLKLHPEVNVVFAHNDRMAIGASKVAKASGREDIKIIGIDAAPKIGIQAVADSVIDVTFIYPTEGDIIIQEALKILKGEKFNKEEMLPITSAVDLSNADILLLQNKAMEEDTQKIKNLKGQVDDYLSKYSAQSFLFYAIVIILLLLFGFLFMVLRSFWENRRYQENLKNKNSQLAEERDKQKELNERLEEATTSKLAFFTNVSHDLRTPLTLIAEPVAQLNAASNLTSSQQNLMKIADKNIKILLRLINQILDFRKYENNKLTLTLTEIDFRQLMREWYDSFLAVARKRHINFTLEEPEGDDPVTLGIDVEKIERVVFNLISNALKYSADNSKISISYKIEGDKLELCVSDTGKGISHDDVTHIFDRFYQAEKVRPKGSGIGLSLAKAFVELHGGEITVESEVNKGSVFTVSLPILHVSSKPEEISSGISREDVSAELEEVDADLSYSEDKPLLLVIDDNKDIRELVAELMKDDYNVIAAPGGKEGIRKAIKYVPDLIICDVMMPGIDGMETTSKLKSEEATSHIPILMLTACSMDEQRVEGYSSGADGYLAKPFSSQVLKAYAGSLISNRKRIKDIYAHTSVAGRKENKATPKPTPGQDIDNDFFNRFVEIFDREMGDPDVNVESLASKMGLERTQFYRKIKAITNYSPVELMRNIRLKKARNLLTATDKTISEICYEVGFSTPAYFTKCYREAYGETPSETRQNIAH